MTASTFTRWLSQWRELERTVRRLDLRLHTDASVEPAPSQSDDQIHTAVWAKAAVTSHGTPVIELEYSGCLRLRYQAPAATDQAAPVAITPRVSLAQ